MGEVFVPTAFFFVTGFVIVFITLTRHKERMAMVEKGLSPEEIRSMFARTMTFKLGALGTLKWGILLLFVGLGALVAMGIQATWNPGEGIYPTLMLMTGGTGLILYYFIASRKQSE